MNSFCNKLQNKQMFYTGSKTSCSPISFKRQQNWIHNTRIIYKGNLVTQFIAQNVAKLNSKHCRFPITMPSRLPCFEQSSKVAPFPAPLPLFSFQQREGSQHIQINSSSSILLSKLRYYIQYSPCQCKCTNITCDKFQFLNSSTIKTHEFMDQS